MTIQVNTTDIPLPAFQHISMTLDDELSAIWCTMKNSQRACFTPELLSELYHAQAHVNSVEREYSFYILSSESSSVFNLGGDLQLFRKLIIEKDRTALYNYMKLSVDALYSLTMLPTRERVAVVQGMAFGGGFESALACDTIIAEKKATFGFPDRLFNLFPGIGAYSYLVRRIEPVKARKMIKSAKTYRAEELYDMGIVDILVENGEGYDALHDHIKYYQRYSNSFDAIKHVANVVHPVSYEEILKIGELWVNSAMKLTSRDIGLMERLYKSQQKLVMP